MRDRTPRMVMMLALAMAAALAMTALPESMAMAAGGPRACHVTNLDKGIGRDTLQRAVWAADPGDRLVVRGTCVGTTLIKKELSIDWVELGPVTECKGAGHCKIVARGSGTPILRSGSRQPAIVVDPRVERLEISPGLRIQGGITVQRIRDWKQRLVPAADAAPRPADGGKGLRACQVTNRGTGDRYRRMQPAVDAAAPGDDLVFSGKCWGDIVIDKRISITGFRVAMSSIECDRDGCTKPVVDDSGVPIITTVTLRPGSAGVRLRRLTVPQGFAIR